MTKEDGVRPEPITHKEYKSPFALLDHEAAGELFPYEGTLGEVLGELESAVGDPEGKNSEIIALHPPRIIRAAVDYKVEQPASPVSHNLLKSAIGLGLQVYRDPLQSRQQIESFRQQVGEEAKELFTLPLVQHQDRATWDATHPDKSQRTAEELAEKQRDDILMIALAHGGVAAGMDVFLRYCDLKQSRHSSLYVVRMCHNSTLDRAPRISDSEEAYLREQAADREVVIFDEDRATGATLDAAELSIRPIVGKPVTAIANVEMNTVYFSD